jgi:hypothetical protein
MVSQSNRPPLVRFETLRGSSGPMRHGGLAIATSVIARSRMRIFSNCASPEKYFSPQLLFWMTVMSTIRQVIHNLAFCLLTVVAYYDPMTLKH